MCYTVLDQNVLVCNDVGWWNGFKKVGDIIFKVDIGLCNILDNMGTKNQVAPSHGYPIESSIVVADDGRISLVISFSIRR